MSDIDSGRWEGQHPLRIGGPDEDGRFSLREVTIGEIACDISGARFSLGNENNATHRKLSGRAFHSAQPFDGGRQETKTLNTTDPRVSQSCVNSTDHEATWVAGAKAGYALCFEELVRRNQARIFRLATRIMQNREDAEDVLQETFLKAYQHLHQFRGDSRFSTWLVRIAINEARMKLRKRGPNQLTFDEPVETEGDSIPREIEDWGPSPEQKYAQTQLQQIISEAIDKLPQAFRVVFLLRDVEKFSSKETAQLLGLSVPAVKSRLLRARLQLRSNLNKYFRLSATN